MSSSTPWQTTDSPTWQNPAFVFGGTKACSGQGSVNASTAACECADGWDGLSDFVSAQYVQCHVNIWAIKALWIINLVVFIAVFVYSIPRIYILLERFAETKRVTPGSRLIDNKGLVSLLLFFGITFPCQLIVGFLRIFQFERKVGIDILITFFWALHRVGFYSAVAIHQPALMRHMLQAQDATLRVVRNGDLAGRAIAVFASLSSLWAVPILATEGRNIDLARACFFMYAFTQTMTFFLLYIQARYVETNLSVILTAAYAQTKNQAILILRDKLSIGQETIVRQSRLQVIFYAIFCIIPMLWITHDYLLVISWFGPIVMSKRVVDSIFIEKENHEVVQGKAVPAGGQGGDEVQQRARGRHKESALSDLQSQDVGTVVEVTETSPALLARGYQWEKTKNAPEPTT